MKGQNLQSDTETLGGILRQAREAKGLPIEQAAHETRIRANLLREFEADNFSHLAPGYVRMFVADYAKYLGLPETAVKRHLPESGVCGVDGYQYLQSGVQSGRISVAVRPAPVRSRLASIVTAVLVVALGFGAMKLWITIRNLDRLSLGQYAQSDRETLVSELVVVEEKATPVEPAPAPADEVKDFSAVGEAVPMSETVDARPSDGTEPDQPQASASPAHSHGATFFVGGSGVAR